MDLRTLTFRTALAATTVFMITGCDPPAALDLPPPPSSSSRPPPPANSQCAPPASAVAVAPGDDLQAAIDAHPTATAFVLRAGIHRIGQPTFPKANQKFYGDTDGNCRRLTTLSGARSLTGFERDANQWKVTGQRQNGEVRGDCQPGWERCSRPEDLFIDDVPQRHVTSRSAVVAGTWFFDYDADTAYLGSDPSGHRVELATTRSALAARSPAVVGVTIANLIVEKFATPLQGGAIGDMGAPINWTVEYNELRWNHAKGIVVGSRSVVRGNYVHDNGQMAVGGEGNDILVEGNELARNNYAHVDPQWEAGGTKFALTNRLVVRTNCVHHNGGPGLWTDTDNMSVLYEDNVVFDNDEQGIHHEVSFDATIRNNRVGRNGKTNSSWLYGAQILISTSKNTEVHGNIVETGPTFGNGIGVIWQDRPPYSATGNRVHDNDVTMYHERALTGFAHDLDSPTAAFFETGSTNANRYHLTDVANDQFMWANRPMTFAELKVAGQESGATLDKAGAPRTWQCPPRPRG